MRADLAVFYLVNGLALLAGIHFIFFGDRTVWVDPRTKFEIVVLRPLFVSAGAGAVAAMINAKWALAATLVVTAFFVAQLVPAYILFYQVATWPVAPSQPQRLARNRILCRCL